jgi:hypothetical protein
MKKHLSALALGFGMALAASVSSAAPIVGTFTGSAAGQGLDLQGSFNYALTVNGAAAGLQIGDASFTNAAATAGAVLTHQMTSSIAQPTYSGSADDLKLGQVMRNLVWSNAGQQPGVSLTLGNLTVGQTYKVQFLFGESCCARGFDVFQDGALLVDNFSTSSAGINNTLVSTFLSNEFMATSNSVVFSFGGSASMFGDNNPVFHAATLEALDGAVQVPEPASFGLLLGGLAMLGLRRRKGRAA